MKSFLMALGVFSVARTVLFIIIAAVFIPRAINENREAATYVQAVVPIIVNHWNARELIDRSTPQLLCAAKSQERIVQLL